MPKLSAGLLVHRARNGAPELLLAHPGGPFWARRDDGVWSVPKGEYRSGEDPWTVAQREFGEELGLPAPAGSRVDLGAVKQPGDLDVTDAQSNTFDLEWPKGSGHIRTFPEVDRVGWFTPDEARTKLLKGQRVFVDRLLEQLRP